MICIDCCNNTEDTCDICGEPCCCGDNAYNEDNGNCYLCINCLEEFKED